MCNVLICLFSCFRGKGGPDQKDHELNIELFGNVNPDESKFIVRARGTEIVLIKENLDAPFWTRLTKDNTKKHWLKVDFSKWKDEDDDEEPEEGGPPPGAGGPPGGGDFEEMMRQMGGLGGAGGMPDFGGGGADFGDLDGGEDSDDDELPDLEEAKDEKPQ